MNLAFPVPVPEEHDLEIAEIEVIFGGRCHIAKKIYECIRCHIAKKLEMSYRQISMKMTKRQKRDKSHCQKCFLLFLT